MAHVPSLAQVAQSGDLSDFTGIDDPTLDVLRVAVLTEQERRQRMAMIPAQVQALTQAYLDAGGTTAALQQAVVSAPPTDAGDDA